MTDRPAVAWGTLAVAAAVAWTVLGVSGEAGGLQWFAGSLGIATLVAALAGGWSRLLGWSVAALLAQYVVAQSTVLADPVDVAWHALLLLMVVECGAASLERRTAEGEGGPSRRPAVLVAGTVAAGVALAGTVAVATELPAPGGRWVAAVAVGSAIAVLVAVGATVGRGRDFRP